MSPENSKKFMILSGQHIANINKVLENIKSNVLGDYIRADNRSLAIITNKVTSESNLTTVIERKCGQTLARVRVSWT